MVTLRWLIMVVLLMNAFVASAEESFSRKDILSTDRAFFADRRKEDNHWRPMRVYPLEKFARIMQLLDGSASWNGQAGAAAVGALGAHPPGATICLSGALGPDGKPVDPQTITLCYGNQLFWHRGRLFMASEAAMKWLDAEFPENAKK